MDSNHVKIKCSIDFDLNRLNCSDGTPRSYQLFLFVSSKNKIDTLIFSCNTSKSNFIGLDSFILENPNIWVIEKLKSPLFEKVHLNIKVYDFKIMKEVEYDLGMQDLAIRTLELVQQKDSIGESFYFKLNGKPIFIKGANWVPADVFLPRVSHEKYRNLLLAAKDADMNMLRVWGGGIYEDEYFYHLCDSLGIMVWQDLPFACSMYPIDSYIDSIPVIDSISGELLSYKAIQSRKFNEYDKISKNFISSFSIICGNNEIDESWKNWGWQQQYHYSKKDSTEIWNNYLSLFKRMIPLTLNEINSGIPYIPSSPKFGWGHPESLTNGDSHYWGVWWGMEPYEIYKKRVPRFASEYGMQSLPCLATIKKFAPDSSLRINSVAMRNHQKHPTGFENLDGYLKYYGFKVNGGYVKGRKVISEYGKGNPDEIDSTNRFVKFSKFDKSPTEKEFEAYINATQQLQADALRTAIEAHLKAQPRCMGTLIWQLNDCWPGASWSLIDYYGSKKKAYYEVQKLFKKAK
jgi:beta-mannosidase